MRSDLASTTVSVLRKSDYLASSYTVYGMCVGDKIFELSFETFRVDAMRRGEYNGTGFRLQS